MNGITIMIISIVVLLTAYLVYGRWLAKKWGIDIEKPTPANTLKDGIDYVPSDAKVILGHHFSSIAGAGPITGPIAASIFGWLPVYLWIIIGSIFIGGVHDFSSLFASIRHDGKSIGEIIKINIGKRGKLLFNIFAYFRFTRYGNRVCSRQSQSGKSRKALPKVRKARSKVALARLRRTCCQLLAYDVLHVGYRLDSLLLCKLC